MIRLGNLLKIEREQGTVTLDAAIDVLHSKLQAASLLGRNSAAEEYLIGVDLRRRLLDVSDGTLDELGPACAAIAFPATEFGLEAAPLGKFQKRA